MLKYVSYLALVGRVFGVDYRNHGTDWKEDQCSGDHQSPIDLKTDLDNVYYEDDKFFKHYENLNGKTVWNADSFTTNVAIEHTLPAPLVTKWRPNYFKSNFQEIKQDWKASQIKFHSKSEHTIDGVRYDLEMAIEHDPETTEKGYTAAIIGVLFDAQRYDDTVTAGQVDIIDKFFDSIAWESLNIDTITAGPVLETAGQTITLGPLMNMLQTNNRYVYTGSFTTPPCTEKVYWNVVNKVYPIKMKHLNAFRYLQAQQKRQEADKTKQMITMEGNYRSTQAITAKHDAKLMILTPPDDDPEEIKKINHILIIILVVVAVMVIICSGLIFMILQGVQQLAEKKKSQRGMVVKNYDDDDMEFGPVKSSRQAQPAPKFNGKKMSSGNFDEEIEDSARGINHNTRVENNMNRNLKGEAAPELNGKEPKFKFHRGYKGPEDLVNFNDFFDAGTTSQCKVCLTREIWDEYKDQSCKEGVSFKLCVFSGIANQDSGIGVYAGSHDAYYKFNKLFDQVIQNYHGHAPGAKHISDMSADGLQNADFTPEQEAMVNSTRIRVGRNMADYPLGPGVSKAQRLDIMNKVVKACDTFTGDLKGKFYPLDGMSKEDQNQLIEDHFLFKEGDRFLESSGLNRDWPSGRGIFHNDAKTFLIWVNEEDQLRIISMQPGADIKAVFERLCRAAHHIETVIKFAHDDHLGYITSCPTNLGTAMRASVHIKLPKLMADKETFNKVAAEYEVQIRGTHGEHTETNDGTFDISNLRRLGKSEKQLVQDMINGVKALMEKEASL